MAELQSCSALLKPPPPSIPTMDHRPSAFLDQPVSDHQGDKQDPSTALQSRFFTTEGERCSFQFEAVLSPRPPPFKRAKWEELHSDNTFNRHPTGVTLPTLTANVGNFASNLPISRSQSHAHTSIPLNGNLPPAVPAQCNVFMGQLPSPVSQQLPLSGVYTTASTSALVSPKSGGASAVIRSPTSEQFRTNGLNLAEVLSELERERQKNADLLERVSSLEARLEERERSSAEGEDHVAGAGFQVSLLDGSKRSKRHRKMEKTGESEEGDLKKIDNRGVGIKQEEGSQTLGTYVRDGCNGQGSAVTWMSREEVQLPDLERPAKRDADSDRDEFVDSDYTDDDNSSSDEEDDDDEEEDEYDDDDEDMQMKDNERRKIKRQGEGDVNVGVQLNSVGPGGKSFDVSSVDMKGEHGGMVLSCPAVGRDHGEGIDSDEKRVKRRKKRRRERNKVKAMNVSHPGKKGSSYEMVPYKVHGMMSSYKKAPKTAFCPKEVKRIMESGVLALKNAQSHTMRKIIVFASLAIRHGCEDLYELDFNHFSIIRRGEPYVSPKDPGEHVLYDHPGVRRRIFYPNRQNPILCPVRILDEERTMRPAGPSCPSCLFLCIKYGGRTRNLPQNEYVRQRMGRNKLKSFGPLMCQMALLVHIRTGSFFFKALGITLLFMAGFPDDLVRKETKYRNLDLLQKYYRSDEDAEGDLLFHPYPPFYPQALLAAPAVPAKAASAGTKSTAKKQPPPLLSKPPGSQTAAPLYLPPITARPLPGAPFGGTVFPGLVGSLSPLPPLPPAATVASSAGATSGIATGAVSSGTAAAPLLPPPYGIFPPYPVQRPPAGGYPPMHVWPPVSSFPPGPFPSPPYGYQPFAHATQYGSPPYYGNPFLPFPPAGAKRDSDKKDDDLEESDSDSESSSSGADQKSEKENSSNSKDAEF